MIGLSGVLVVLALASQCADGQPTHDFGAFDDFHWRDDHDLLEQIAMNLRHVIVQQEEHKQMTIDLQLVIAQQGERMEQLEQMLSESVEGQHRMEMQQQQQVEHQMTRYVSLQQQFIENITAKLDAVSVNIVETIKNDKNRRNQSTEQLEMTVNSMEPVRQGMDQIMVMIEQGQSQLTEIVNEQIVGIVNNLTQSQQQMFSEVSQEVDRKMNEALVMSTQSYAELLGHITENSHQIQRQLTRIQEDLRTQDECELLDDNITVTLADIEGTCIAIGSNVNTTEETLVQEFHEQRRILLENSRLLGTLNHTWMMSAEQSLQQQNNAFNDITNQLVAIQGDLSGSM